MLTRGRITIAAIRDLTRRFRMRFAVIVVCEVVSRFLKAITITAIVAVFLSKTSLAGSNSDYALSLPVFIGGLSVLYIVAALTEYLSHQIVLGMELEFAKTSTRAEIGIFYAATSVVTNGFVFGMFLVAAFLVAPLPTLAILGVTLVAYFSHAQSILIVVEDTAERVRAGAIGRARLTLVGNIVIAVSVFIIYILLDHIADWFELSVIAYLLFVRYMIMGLQAGLISFQRLGLVADRATRGMM